MKLNFWQILGIVLLVVGGGWWLYQKYNTPKPGPAINNPPAATTPATPAPAPAPTGTPTPQ
ncbi:MAG TPA: hypothetical protein VK986_14190 [Tepidisphaeraceae bacterium]|nr:hypothetical protein [Tepidisphaeraceae bacterium]